MLKLTNKGKIKRLKKLLWLNFNYNFTSKCTYGLCGLYQRQYNLLDSCRLFDDIPELYEFKYYRGNRIYGYWWPDDRFIGWWYRHWAIVRAIWKLKRL
jgi:hypothetical protein